MINLNTLRVLGEPSSFSGSSVTPGAMLIPLQTMTVAKPLSYEFRVAEYTDQSGKITKVALQMQVWEHDNYGVGIIKQAWFDVPRITVPS